MAPPALAQPAPDPDPPDTEYHTGAILTPEAELRSFPTTPEYRAYLPPSVNLARSLPRPGNQGRQGSCTAWAVGYAVRAYYVRAHEGRNNRRSANIPSPAYIYNSVRTGGCNDGSRTWDALELLRKGALSLRQYPYRQHRCARPSASQRARATGFRIERWFRVSTSALDQIKAELAQGHPVVFASRFTRSFDRHRGRGVYRRRRGERDGRGGHALAIIGYDERRQAVRVMNSWGRRWGDRGYAWVAYDEIGRGHEAYVMRPATKIVPPPKPPKPIVPPKPPPLVVSDLDCSKVLIAKDGGRTRVTGFVGNEAQIAILKKRLEGKQADFNVAVRPWPQCEALLTLDKALAAQDRPTVRVLTGKRKALKRGDLLKIEVKSPHQPAHVHVAYIQADGSVVHLVQADAGNLRTVAREQVLKFGDGEEGRARFTVGSPFGQEMVIALATRSPLFAAPRPQNETERQFLTALRGALALRAKGEMAAHGGVRAAVATLTTEEKVK